MSKWTEYDSANPATWPTDAGCRWVIVSDDGYQTAGATFYAVSTGPVWGGAGLRVRWWCAPPDGPLVALSRALDEKVPGWVVVVEGDP